MTSEAQQRVAEFLRQIELLRDSQGLPVPSANQVSSVWADPEAEQATLTVEDLHELLAQSSRWRVTPSPDGKDFIITHSDFPGWHWNRSAVADGTPVAEACDRAVVRLWR